MSVFFIVVVAVAGVALTIAYALCDVGAHDVVASFGRFVVRIVTFGKVRLADEGDESVAIGVAGFTVVGLFLLLVLVSNIA